MKILFLTNLYPPNAVGGYEQLCFDVASAFVERGHEVAVLTSSYGSSTATYPGQTIFRDLKLFASEENIYRPRDWTADERDSAEWENERALKEVCAEYQPDVVFVWNLYFLTPVFLDAVDRVQIPTFYFLTDNWLAAFLVPAYVADFFRTHVFGKPSALHRLRAICSRCISKKKLDAYAICSSFFMENFYRSAGLRFRSMTVIHNGIQLPSVAVDVHKRAAFLRPNELNLLFAGRVVEIKGLRTVICALSHIIRALPGLTVRLTIVGDQQDMSFVDEIRKKAGELDVLDRVTWSKPVSENKLPELFGRHDVYLFPSLYEPFSLTLLHAMSSGIPIIASRAGGNPEAIRDGYSGILHNAGDHIGLANAVVALAKKPYLRIDYVRNAIQESKNFGFDRMVVQLERYLENNR